MRSSVLIKNAAHFCMESKAMRKTSHSVDVWRRGLIEGTDAEKILLDTGCSRTLVRQELIPREKMLEGEAVTIRCAHGV